MKKHRRALTVLGVIVVALLVGAGSCDEKGLGDAPVGDAYEAPRTVIVMPDQFANLMVACDGPTRIYVTTREAPPVVVADHPACDGEPVLEDQGEAVEYQTDSGEDG